MNKRIFIKLIVLAIGLSCMNVQAFAPSNFFRPYDYALRFPFSKKTKFRVGVQSVEYGSRSTGENCDSDRRNILQLCSCTQNAIAMTRNPTTEVLNKMTPPLKAFFDLFEDNGRDGHIRMSGDFQEVDLNFFASYKLPISEIPGTLAVSLYVPVIWKKIDDVCCEDLTVFDPVFPDGGRNIKRFITDKLQQNVKDWGCLDICCNWDDTSLGDIALMLEWSNIYHQDKEWLKAVMLYLKGGVLFPTAEEADENIAVSMPLGFDGAWGLPLGFGIELDFKKKVHAGVDVDFFILFDETRNRRMKTHVDQTEFLLLNKGRATKEYGLTWQFHLWAQAYHVFRGLSAKFAYQYIKHDDDRLIPKCNDFDFCLVNSDCRLKEWSVHNLIFMLNYDAFDECKKWKIKPQVSLFYKLPVAGKCIIDTHTIGGQVAVSF